MNNTQVEAITELTDARHDARQPLPWQQVLLGDCLEVTERWPKGTIDLIYADPPFFTNREHRGGPDPAGAQQLRFQDRWQDGLSSYLTWLEERVRALRLLLKPHGVFLLHLDWHAVHYAKVMCDAVFAHDRVETGGSSRQTPSAVRQNAIFAHSSGRGGTGGGTGGGAGGGFQNELIWYYQTGGASKDRFSRKHDTILLYSMAKHFYFDGKAVAIPRGKGAMHRAKCPTGARIKLTDTHKNPDDVLVVPALNPMARERNGYPTQKPVGLLEILIKALCPPGGGVADLFCGSGTTLVAAARLGRKWVGCDVNPAAVKLARERVSMESRK